MLLARKLYETYAGHRKQVEGKDLETWENLSDVAKGRFAAMAGCARRELAVCDHDSVRVHGKTICADLWYPKTNGPASTDAVQVTLVDVRAAADIYITYDYDRDGWVVSQMGTDADGAETGWEEVAFVDAWALQEADTVDGADRAPDRYMTHGRETIDRQRDLACEQALGHKRLADMLFAFHCDATALAYEDRNGAKGDPEGDAKKARWYRQMARHVRAPRIHADPRGDRPGFVPYEHSQGCYEDDALRGAMTVRRWNGRLTNERLPDIEAAIVAGLVRSHTQGGSTWYELTAKGADALTVDALAMTALHEALTRKA